MIQVKKLYHYFYSYIIVNYFTFVMHKYITKQAANIVSFYECIIDYGPLDAIN